MGRRSPSPRGQGLGYVTQSDNNSHHDNDWGFPDGSVSEESASNAGDTGDAGLIPGLSRSPGGGNGNSLQYSCPENPTAEERGGLQCRGSHRLRHDGVSEHSDNVMVRQQGRRAETPSGGARVQPARPGARGLQCARPSPLPALCQAATPAVRI